MRICLLSEYFYPDSTGGTGTVLSELSRHLKDNYQDVQIDVITSINLYRGEVEGLQAQELWRGIRIFRLRTPKSNRPSALLRLAAGFVFSIAALLKLLTMQQYDLVLVVTNPPSLALAAKLFKHLRGTPYLYLIHDLYPDFAIALKVLPPTGKLSQGLRLLQRNLLHSSSRTVVVGRCMKDYLVANYAMPPEKIAVLTNWSDPVRFQPDGESQFRANNQLSGTVVLYAGNMGHYVNLDDILDAAKLLIQKRADIRIVLVGDGPRKAHIAGRIVDEGITNVSLFSLVPQQEYPDLLAAADVSLVTLAPGVAGLGVPSKFYNILACGQPTVALVAPNSEVARVLDEADCGFQIDDGNPARLAEVLLTLSSSPEMLSRMGRNARASFEKSFTLAAVAERLHSLLVDLTNCGGSEPGSK